MSTHKYIDKICVLITAIVLLLTILFMNGEALGITAIESEDESSGMFTANDLNGDWDIANATEITLSDDGTTVKGNGAYVYNGDIYIAYAGKYILSGELSNGNIIVSADGDDKIWLMLDGVSIHCEDDAAIRIEQADKVFITLADGTENTLSSGSQYEEDVISAGVDGTIYSRDDLTINGSGTLYVTSEYQHGIVCNDDLALVDGTITVEAVQDGFHANDSIRIRDTNIAILAGDDGMTVSNDDETAFLYVESGNINISSCYEGLEAIAITIAGGTIDITATDDGINANGNSNNSVIQITGGDITITNGNGRDADGLDSNKDIYISGGNLFISLVGNGSNSAIDCGTESGGVCEISGGTVIACGSSAMAEGFDSSSSQGFLMYNTSADEGTTVTLESNDGRVVLSEEIPYIFSSVLISTPEMAVGDTYTISVGETAEEVTIDNSSNNFGSGGGGMFGGGRDRGNMRGDFPADSENANEASPDMQTPSNNQRAGGINGNKQGGARPTLPDGTTSENGGQMPEIPNGINDGGTQPEIPNGTNDGDTQPEIPSGANDGDMQPDFSQGKGNFGDRADDNGMMGHGKGNFMGDMGQEENASAESNASSVFTVENCILLGVSVIVLIFGCVIAGVFKRR